MPICSTQASNTGLKVLEGICFSCLDLELQEGNHSPFVAKNEKRISLTREKKKEIAVAKERYHELSHLLSTPLWWSNILLSFNYVYLERKL